ncbi:MAG: tetratricopeptide repeat protein [Candidatus Magasanikbacteria bacterium]
MLNILFLLVTLICLGVVGFVIWKKIPQLSNLDVDNLPQEKTSRKKREIITKRIEAHSREARVKLGEKLRPVDKIWREFQLKFRVYVGKIERLIHHEDMIKTKQEQSLLTVEEKESRLKNLIQDGENNLSLENLDKAERIFIAAIKIDVKSASAYRGLAEVYLKKGAVEEAKQTFAFLLQLEPENDAVMVRLAEMAEAENNIDEAIEYYQRAMVANDSLSPRFAHLAELLLKVGQPLVAKEAVIQAVELEPQNPKYLDLLIETAILCQDKKLAGDAYQNLRLVNPENSKLADFRHRIEKI